MRQVHVGLEVVAADDVPAAGFHQGLHGGESGRIAPQDFLVDETLAADEGELGPLVHELDDGAHGGDGLGHALGAIPEPDGVEMGVADEVENGARGHG